jgi:hypothetical protein
MTTSTDTKTQSAIERLNAHLRKKQEMDKAAENAAKLSKMVKTYENDESPSPELTFEQVIAKWNPDCFHFEGNPRDETSGDYSSSWVLSNQDESGGTVLATRSSNGMYQFTEAMGDLFPEGMDWFNEECIDLIKAFANEQFSLQLGSVKAEEVDNTSMADYIDRELLNIAEITMNLERQFPEDKDRDKRHFVFRGMHRGEQGDYGLICSNQRGIYLQKKLHDPKGQTHRWVRANVDGSNNQIAWKTDKGQWLWSTQVQEWISKTSLDRDGNPRTMEELNKALGDYVIWQIYNFLGDENTPL